MRRYLTCAFAATSRATRRKDRQRTPVPNAAIVGYTNSGKSSLLRRLTGADVLVEDKLFATLDTTGVGQLMQTGVEKGRATKPDLKIGICGEHGGDPSSVVFCHKIGLNYVSCSPFRVPIARLAAAQAALQK